MMEAPSFESGDLVIDMTLSDDEEPTRQTENELANPLEPKVSLEVPEVDAVVPTELAASSTPQDPLGTPNLILGSMHTTSPPSGALVPHQGPAAQIKDPNLLGILGNYTPSELARVTTQAMIECIARFPALWDSQEPSYHNHKYCSLLWKNIAVVLNMNVKRAKAKWYSLRSAFRKEFAKSRATGIPSRFTYFKALSFLETETLREKEREDVEKSKLIDILKRTKPTLNGTSSVNADNDDNVEDDDCIIVENLEDCSEGPTPNAADSLVISTQLSLKSEVNNRPDSTPLGQKATAQPVNGTAPDDEIASVNKQPRPSFVIRAKNISELMAVPPPVPASTLVKHSRSHSPEVVFHSEQSQSIAKVPTIVVSDAFPSPSSNNELLSEQSSYQCSKTNLDNEMKSTVHKVLDKQSKISKKKSKKQNILNGSSSNADSTAMRILKGSQPLPKSKSELPKPGNEPSGSSKTLNGTVLGKRASEIAPSSSKLMKKPKLSHSESTKGNNRPRDPQECSEMNKGFLMSLLSDVEGMSNAQFRTFKKQATTLVSMILDK
uniref:MADF domain-containing protein n=1 Tax=Lygus hesperus TaxID=30085 RepID=A0A146L4E0_LYGHE